MKSSLLCTAALLLAACHAWTDGGFLVVWDEGRAPYNYTLFSSFIAVEAIP